MIAWRGVVGNVGSAFNENDLETWWSVNSCSKALNVIEIYLGDTGTVFAIEVINGKDISAFSVFQNEHEVVLMPGSRLRVKSDSLNHRDSLFIVHLQEEEASGAVGNEDNSSNDLFEPFGFSANPFEQCSFSTDPFQLFFNNAYDDFGDQNRNNSYDKSNRKQRLGGINLVDTHHESSDIQNMQQVSPAASNAQVDLLWEPPMAIHLERSIGLQCITQKPFRARLLPKEVKYQVSKVISANDQFLLLCGDSNLHLFDEELKLIKSTKNARISSNDLTDIAWCESIQKFIVLTKDHAYVFDPVTTQLSRIENIGLKEKEDKFVSCTCSPTKLFIATSKTYDTSYLHVYKLPSLTFMDRFTVGDLIRSNSKPEQEKSKYSWSNKDKESIISVRHNQQRLGMIIETGGKQLLYTLDLTEKPCRVAQIELPLRDGRLTVIRKSGEWLITPSHFERKCFQIALDCQFRTEWEAKVCSKSSFFSFSTGFIELKGDVDSVIMFGSSYLVLVLDNSLALYNV